MTNEQTILRAGETNEQGKARRRGGQLGNRNAVRHGRRGSAAIARRKVHAELARRTRAGIALMRRLLAGEALPRHHAAAIAVDKPREPG